MSEQALAPSHPAWRQFSLRTLMIAVTVLCVLFALAVAPPLLALVMAAMYFAGTGILAIAIWQGRGWIRAFAVGAMLPHVMGYLIALVIRESAQWFIMSLLLIVVVTCVSGIAAAAFHGVLARRGGELPVPNLPLLRSWLTNDWYSEPASEK